MELTKFPPECSIKAHNPSQVVSTCHSFQNSAQTSAKISSSLNLSCQWRSGPSTSLVCQSDMATKITREPLLETIRTLPQQGSGSPHHKANAKWYPLTRLWTDTIEEFRSEVESTKWVRTTEITFFLCLCCVWAIVLVFLCIFVPLLSSDYNNFGNHCAPDGSFRLEPSSLLAPAWFFQVVLGFGSLQFTAVKAIDIVWDVVSGFNNTESLR